MIKKEGGGIVEQVQFLNARWWQDNSIACTVHMFKHKTTITAFQGTGVIVCYSDISTNSCSKTLALY